MVKKKVTTTTTVTEEIIDGSEKKPLKICLLLDNSGSMGSIVERTRSSINEYIDSMKQASKRDDIKMDISVIMFSSGLQSGHVRGGLNQKTNTVNFSVLIPWRNINEVNEIERNQIRPDGGTPLYDAIGYTVNDLNKVVRGNENVAFVILTDGEENSSQEYTAQSISAILKRKQDENNWLVTYLGANQNAWLEGQKFGSRMGSTMSYDVNAMNATFQSLAASTMRYSQTNSLGAASFTAAERSLAMGGDGGTVVAPKKEDKNTPKTP